MFKVPLTQIKAVSSHPNADKLDICTVYGFNVVAQKGRYKVGDRVIFIPVDSVITNKHLEDYLFPVDSKIKLTNHRIRQIRIRQYPSQGMLIDPNGLKDIGIYTDRYALEDDLSQLLGVIKYEPPVVELPKPGRQGAGRRRNPHPNFHQYNGVENLKWFPDLFKDGEDVVVQEKLHGSNWRGGWLKTQPNTLWKKFLNFINMLPPYEFVYGSNCVEISSSSTYKGFYGTDIYGGVAKKLDVHARIRPNEIVYGEIIGPGIQKNYSYGHREHHLVIFDVKVFDDEGNWRWLDPDQVEVYAQSRGFDVVPTLYKGPYNKAAIEPHSTGPSSYCPEEKVREGIVIKSRFKYNDEYCSSNKKSVKWINPTYLDDHKNTDNH